MRIRASIRALGAVIGATLVAATLLVTMSPIVLAGAGCHDPQTVDRAGTSVDLKGFCMWPTVIRVGVGESVTWRNADEALHTVTGVGGSWGTYDPFGQGQSVTYRFDTAGVFPYFCVLHPGMVGAVVVGNGGVAQTPDGAAAGIVAPTVQPATAAPSAVAASARPGQPAPVSAAPVAAPVQNEPAPSPSSTAGLAPIPVAGLLLLVLLGGLGAGYVLASDRRRGRLAPDRGSQRGS